MDKMYEFYKIIKYGWFKWAKIKPLLLSQAIKAKKKYIG
jgi:hypothetical protein